MPAPRVSPEIRAAALADLHAGDQPAEVAERYGLDRDLVNKWKQRYVSVSADMSADGQGVSVPAPVRRPAVEAQQRRIGELIVDLLRAKLEASAAIAAAAQSPEWLARQSAAELAALGEYLDRSAFAIGDRLAGAAPDDDRSDAA